MRMRCQRAFLRKLRRRQQPSIVEVPGGDLATLISAIVHVNQLKIKLERTITTGLLRFTRNTAVTRERNLVGDEDIIDNVPANEAPSQTLRRV